MLRCSDVDKVIFSPLWQPACYKHYLYASLWGLGSLFCCIYGSSKEEGGLSELQGGAARLNGDLLLKSLVSFAVSFPSYW